MKYDCEKTRDYAHELQRMCVSVTQCSGCPLDGMNCNMPTPTPDLDAIMPILQKWSDEHPEPHRKTYREDFFEKFPNAEKYEDGHPIASRRSVYGGELARNPFDSCNQWDEEMPEDEK